MLFRLLQLLVLQKVAPHSALCSTLLVAKISDPRILRAMFDYFVIFYMVVYKPLGIVGFVEGFRVVIGAMEPLSGAKGG